MFCLLPRHHKLLIRKSDMRFLYTVKTTCIYKNTSCSYWAAHTATQERPMPRPSQHRCKSIQAHTPWESCCRSRAKYELHKKKEQTHNNLPTLNRRILRIRHSTCHWADCHIKVGWATACVHDITNLYGYEHVCKSMQAHTPWEKTNPVKVEKTPIQKKSQTNPITRYT